MMGESSFEGRLMLREGKQNRSGKAAVLELDELQYLLAELWECHLPQLHELASCWDNKTK